MSDVTQILSKIKEGDLKVASELLPLVYSELRRMAAAKMANEKAGQTLQATALVHEAYVRLVDSKQTQDWQSRWHFFAAAAKAMRQILVENARRKKRVKHGGQLERIEFDEVDLSLPEPNIDILVLDEALKEFATEHPEKAELVQLRFFAELSVEQAAEIMNVSLATAARDWRYARAWLAQKIRE